MDNLEKWDELRQKLEKLIQERSRIEDDIFRQEEKFDIRELKETDVRYRNMVWLKDRYNELGLEIDEIRKELENLRGTSPLQKREAELSSLEAEEQTISEAEALIGKQTEKEGQDIGEE